MILHCRPVIVVGGHGPVQIRVQLKFLRKIQLPQLHLRLHLPLRLRLRLRQQRQQQRQARRQSLRPRLRPALHRLPRFVCLCHRSQRRRRLPGRSLQRRSLLPRKRSAVLLLKRRTTRRAGVASTSAAGAACRRSVMFATCTYPLVRRRRSATYASRRPASCRDRTTRS